MIQYAEPWTLYRHPATAEVARLTGATIMLDGTMEGGRVRTALGWLEPQPGAPDAGCVEAMLRPGQVARVAPGEGMPAQRLATAFRGSHTLTTVRVEGVRLGWRLAWPSDVPGTLRFRVAGPCLAYAAPQG